MALAKSRGRQEKTPRPSASAITTGAFAYNALRSVCLSSGAPERLGWCRWIRTRFWRPAPLRRIHWRGQERQVWERRSLFVRPKHLDLSVQERPDRLPPRNRSGLAIEARQSLLARADERREQASARFIMLCSRQVSRRLRCFLAFHGNTVVLASLHDPIECCIH